MKADKLYSLYIVSKSQRAGSMLITLGFAELLLRTHGKIAFFRPLVPPEADPDPDAETILEHFALQQSYESAAGIPLDEAERMISEGRLGALLETVVERFSALREAYDFVLCEGLADERLSQLIDFDLNIEIAKNLAAPIVGVFSAKGQSAESLEETVNLWGYALEKQGAERFMLIANRCDKAVYDAFENTTAVVALPEIRSLDRPNVLQLADGLGAEVLIGNEEQLLRIVGEPRIAAMHLEHFLDYLRPDDLVIVPADRSDIILGAMTANYARNVPSVSAILLTGDLTLAPAILELIRGLDAIHIPLLHLRHDTMQSALMVQTFPSRIDTRSPKKIATALGVFHKNIDETAVTARLAATETAMMTPVMFEHRLFERAAKQIKRIVLPETDDDRILRAADILLRRRAVEIFLLGTEETLLERAAALGLDFRRARIVDPDEETQKLRLAKAFYTLRRHKGMTLEAAYDAVGHATVFATMMVAEGDCDGLVSGATHTTRDTILPALQTIKTRPGSTIVSSCFFMCFDTRVLVYADCAVNPDPTAAELAEIAVATADTALRFGIEPRVAMLSYSTGSSGVGSDVDKVRAATEIVHATRPDLIVDGPMQYDAAIDPGVGAQKMPGSAVAGQATVFIFPDLNTGNNTYKAVQRSSGAVAVGPVLQGLNKPVNDLSRGCSVVDIVNTVAITAIQAQGK